MKRSISIALAFVGLMVGAGFATGQEVIQYFISFGLTGIWGVVLSGVLMTLAGAVILQLGSYFMADEHNKVFRNVSHPIVSRILDWSVVLTLFAVGFVMLAGAGSNLEQQFGLKSFIGAGIMTLMVIATGFLNVDKVSNIISMITPVIIIAVVFVFAWTMTHLPENTAGLSELAAAKPSPVSPWWLSALNYNGLALMLGVSMCLVIGGSHSDPKAAGRGGLMGGLLYTIMLLMAALALFFNGPLVLDAPVPMLELFNSIHPWLAQIMVWIIFAMIYNTCIGMFYALGRRLTASQPERFAPVYIVVCLIGYGVSFVGFSTLMTYVYPLIGYIGILMVVVLVAWWAKSRVRINRESKIRERIGSLLHRRLHPERRYTRKHAQQLRKAAEEADAPNREIVEMIGEEVSAELEADPEVDYERPDNILPPKGKTDPAIDDVPGSQSPAKN